MDRSGTEDLAQKSRRAVSTEDFANTAAAFCVIPKEGRTNPVDTRGMWRARARKSWREGV